MDKNVDNFEYFYDVVDHNLYGYRDLEEAQEHHHSPDNLVKLSPEMEYEFRFNKPAGGVWTEEGWVVDPDVLLQERMEYIPDEILRLQDEKLRVLQDMQMKALLGKLEEAKELAQKAEDIAHHIKELEEVLNEQTDT